MFRLKRLWKKFDCYAFLLSKPENSQYRHFCKILKWYKLKLLYMIYISQKILLPSWWKNFCQVHEIQSIVCSEYTCLLIFQSYVNECHKMFELYHVRPYCLSSWRCARRRINWGSVPLFRGFCNVLNIPEVKIYFEII